MLKEMEHTTTQPTDQGVSLPKQDEISIKESATIQELYAKFEGQLDWPQIESPTAARHAGRQKRRRRAGVVGRNRQEGRIL